MFDNLNHDQKMILAAALNYMNWGVTVGMDSLTQEQRLEALRIYDEIQRSLLWISPAKCP